MEMNREARFWLIGAALLVLALWLLQGILLPFVAGMAIAYFLDPVADQLEHWGLSRSAAVGAITLFFILAAVLAVGMLVPLLLTQGMELINKTPEYLELLRNGWDRISDKHIESLPSFDLDSLRKAVQSAAAPSAQVIGKIFNQGMALLGLVSLLVITPIVAVYLLHDWDRMVARIDDLLPRRHAPLLRGIFQDIDDTLAGFVRGQGTVCLLLGLFYAVGLSLAGLQFGVLVGVFAGLVSFIPYVGATIGGIAAGILALFQFWPDWTPIAIVLGVFAAGQFLEGNFLTPKLIGDRVKLHPVWVMFALFAFGYLFGFVGMLIAVPVAATLGVLTRYGTHYYKLSRFYQDREETTE